MEQNKSKRGGARPGAGRKKGLRSVPEGQRATIRGVSLPLDMWKELDEAAAAESVTVSSIIRRLLNLFFTQKTGEKEMETSAANKWGEAIAILDAATPGGLSDLAKTGAVEHPLKSLSGLITKAKKLTPELDKMLQERLAHIPSLPESLLLEDQGAVWIGYYHLRAALPYAK